MPQPILIVVHGAAAAGKTELSTYLARELRLPLLSKDDIKETLFAHFAHHSIAESDRIDAASLDLLWTWLDRWMAHNQATMMVETAFPEAISQPLLMDLVQRHNHAVVQIHCHAAETVLRQRYVDRARTPDRHPGHQDLARVEGQPIPETSSYHPLNLPGPLIDVDTTDLDAVDYRHIQQMVRKLIGERH